MQLQTGLWVSRVASQENISDDPSRQRYGIMQRIHAKWVEPRLSKLFCKPETWEALSASFRCKFYGICLRTLRRMIWRQVEIMMPCACVRWDSSQSKHVFALGQNLTHH